MPIQVAEAVGWERSAAATADEPGGGEGAGADRGVGREPALTSEVEQIVGWFRAAGRALRASDPANWAEGLTMPQLRVVFFLGRAGPASVGEVAAGLGVAQPSATETLDRLVRAGYVERTADACDRRVVRTALSPAGQELIDRAWETRRAVLASALRRASLRDRTAIAQGLETLCRVLAEDAGTGLWAAGDALEAGAEVDTVGRTTRDQRSAGERRGAGSASPVGEKKQPKKERSTLERPVAPD
jgi:DNA-binding MarR family transcriptional regulator